MEHVATARPVMPRTAFLAVTLLCNSRCIMCDIWKNKGADFLPLTVYRKLPPSLEDIAITGGEPFLRPDIPEMVAVLKETCPKGRILITTHGFMTDKIRQSISEILKADPQIGIRVSLDGLGAIHGEIRGVVNAYEKATATLRMLKEKGVKDLGVIFTLMKKNSDQMRGVFRFAKEQGLRFTLTVAHDSPVYFGEGKASLNPDPGAVKKDFDFIFRRQLMSANPKEWAKAWFNKYAYVYLITHRRPFLCGAGESFFYMDSAANIYMCQFKNWPIGNLEAQTFDDIWSSAAKREYVQKSKSCHDCWMICTAKDTIREKKWAVLKDIPKLIAETFFY